MTARRAWAGQAYLDALRPERGTTVRLALFATYSVDVSAVAAALLALIGRNSEQGSGNVADFAEAIEGLRGRLRIIAQRGRIARPHRLPKIAGILDQFIVEVPHKEAERSWHPKIALVGYDGPGDRRRWKLWIGSRNLTRSRDLDVGLLVEGGPERRPGLRQLPETGALARKLAAEAGRDDAEALAHELAGLWWRAPTGYELRALHLALDDGAAIPMVPPVGAVDAVTIVSPFLCPKFLAQAGSWGPDGHRTLLSTRPALASVARHRLRPLAGFSNILALESPDPVPDVSAEPIAEKPAPLESASIAPDQADEDAEPPPQTLHAKLYSFDQGGRSVILIGSANATDRGWSGRNAELLIEMVGGDEFRAGLDFLIKGAMPVSLEELETAPAADMAAEEALEACRRQLIAQWEPALARHGNLFALTVRAPPKLALRGYRLEVGLANGELVPWQVGADRLDLGEIPLALQSEFIQARIVGPDGSVGWMQRVTVNPPLDETRDAAAIVRHLGFRGFQDWMRRMLTGDPLAVDPTPWDADGAGAAGRRADSETARLTLEDILTGWAKDRAAFGRADRHFGRYVTALLDHADLLDPAERKELDGLREIWGLARERLPRAQ